MTETIEVPVLTVGEVVEKAKELFGSRNSDDGTEFNVEAIPLVPSYVCFHMRIPPGPGISYAALGVMEAGMKRMGRGVHAFSLYGCGKDGKVDGKPTYLYAKVD